MKIEEIREKYSFKENGKVYFGLVKGYQVLIKVDAMAAPVCMGRISVYLKDANVDLEAFLKSKKSEIGLLNFKVSDDGIDFICKAFTMKAGIENLDKTIECLTTYLESSQIDGSLCPSCGKRFAENDILGNNPVVICSECLNVLEEQKKKEAEELKNQPNNFGKGFAGALIGAFVGGLVWILIGLMGYMLSAVAILISFLASVGYDLMKGKQVKTKLYIVTITSVISILFSITLLYIILAGSLGEFVEYLGSGGTDYYIDLFVSLIFGALGISYTVYRLRSKIKKTN